MEMVKVSVCCIAFNQERYIKECLDGILSQETNFLFEVLIFDDASTDGTQEIIADYARRFNQIRLFLQKDNQWNNKRYGLVDFLFPNSKGEFIALCEGDDYWTDSKKLQKQV